jgi:hypothetical protein
MWVERAVCRLVAMNLAIGKETRKILAEADKTLIS